MQDCLCKHRMVAKAHAKTTWYIPKNKIWAEPMNKTWQSNIRNLYYQAQKGLCPICSKPILNNSILDHEHISGSPRGLLCSIRCNNMVAQIETGTKKMNYTMHRNTVSRIEAYLKSYPKLKLVWEWVYEKNNQINSGHLVSNTDNGSSIFFIKSTFQFRFLCYGKRIRYF